MHNHLTPQVFVHTITDMNIIFDAEKDSANILKHRVSLADAALIEWTTAVTWQDVRNDYQEPRMIGLGYIKDRLFCVVFVDRVDNRRIISLRKANLREVNRYAST
jgi:uncharacterized DUF497 family protein